MKTKGLKKKLNLNKASIVTLDNGKLAFAKGGAITGTCGACYTEAVYCTNYQACYTNFYECPDTHENSLCIC